MSADGEIAVSVRAEGADEAAGELGGDGDGGGGPGMGDGGGGGGRMTFGKLLTRVAGLLAFLGPILDVMKLFTDIAAAFLAPFAIMMLRLFTPMAKLLLQILPLYLDKFATLNDWIDKYLPEIPLGFALMVKILQTVVGVMQTASSFLSDVKTSAGNTATRIQDMLATLRELPQRIGNLIPSVGGEGGLVDRGRDFLGLGGDDSGGGGTSVTIGGGLIPFVDRITRDGSVDFP